MNDTLKECPFCGNDGSGPVEEALHVTFSEHDWRDPSWSVQCDRCTATMGYFDTEDEAIAAWNARKSPRTDDLADELRKAHAALRWVYRSGMQPDHARPPEVSRAFDDAFTALWEATDV